MEISENAQRLWKLMLEKGEIFKSTEMANLLGKTRLDTTIKQDLLNAELIRSPKANTYEAVALEPGVILTIRPSSRPEKKVGKKTTKRPPVKPIALTFEEIMDQVGKLCKPYFQRIDELTVDVGEIKRILEMNGLNSSRAQGIHTIPNLKQVGLDTFYKALRDTCHQLDENARFGGEIPIPEIWDGMKNLNLNLTWIDFQGLLRKLEDDRKIDLHVANDSSQVRFPDKGFHDPNRGFIYFVALRT
ncbi:MAG: hypothetical protein RBG13Loki_2751 [Promethearchaeota archaeon CR_4]|nr:MAG: hypothetical protein RBG13Loki_2751 [Candidatus Lokiarchaeota archaeon CR_4]